MIIAQTPLDIILRNVGVMSKIKTAIAPVIEDEQVRMLFMNSNEFDFILVCYASFKTDNSRYIKDFNNHLSVQLKTWKYYYITHKGNYMMSADEELPADFAKIVADNHYELKVYSFDVISKICSDKIFKIWDHTKYIEWYCF
jgi:hypothetical protein